MSVRIHELALPKGVVIPPCEICEKPATTKCEKCRVTHYCCEEHKSIDYKAFHHSVCDMVLDIKTERLVPFSEEGRIEEKLILQNKKKHLNKLAESTARKWLLEINPDYAYPCALIAWNMAKNLWSEDSLEVLYPTCLVAEVFMGLKDLNAAVNYMTVAYWTSQKYTLPPLLSYQINRVKGLVYMAIKNWARAREAFNDCVIALSQERDGMNLRISLAYGYLSLSLLELDDIDGAMANSHKMANKWLIFLLNQFENRTLRSATELEIETDQSVADLEFSFRETKIVFQLLYEKILCIQALSQIRDNCPKEAVVFKEEALATATRTKMDKAVRKRRFKYLVEVLGDDYLLRWERKHNRPRTVATKYLEMIKAIEI